jgi:hypothetical protein
VFHSKFWSWNVDNTFIFLSTLKRNMKVHSSLCKYSVLCMPLGSCLTGLLFSSENGASTFLLLLSHFDTI